MRELESPSSLTLYIKCPYAYKLSYLDKCRQDEESDALKFGLFIHKELEFKDERVVHPKAKEFVDSVNEYLDGQETNIAETETEIYFEVGGQSFRTRVDAFTHEGVPLEYKVTKSPMFFTSVVSYQIKAISLGLHSQGITLSPVYLLLQHYKQKFRKLIPHIVPFQLSKIKEYREQIAGYVEQIHRSWASNTFPPSYNGCFNCNYKKQCKYFFGGF